MAAGFLCFQTDSLAEASVAARAMMCYICATMDNKPRTINLRDANQQFSKLVREVEESGREFVILRNGKEAARLSPAASKTGERKLTAEQEAALARLMAPMNVGTAPPDWKFNREAMWNEILDEREARKAAREDAEKKAHAKARKRG